MRFTDVFIIIENCTSLNFAGKKLGVLYKMIMFLLFPRKLIVLHMLRYWRGKFCANVNLRHVMAITLLVAPMNSGVH